MPLTIIAHPVAADCLTQLRDEATTTQQFRKLLEELSIFLAIEATRTLATVETRIITPLASCVGHRLDSWPVLAPVLRAGLGFMPGFLRMVPHATVAHLGFFRDPHTLQAMPYYANLPDMLGTRPVFVLDPMLATGNSARAAIELLQKNDATAITLITLLAAQPGIDAIEAAHPNVHIITIAVDPELNEHGYLVPGLGDAGDRQFGTDRSTPTSFPESS